LYHLDFRRFSGTVNWNSKIEDREQIEWENIHLKMADKIVFWFPYETLCPITLFELGKYLVSDKQIFVGCHRKYNKRNDVIIQVGLERPDLIIHDSLKSLSKEIAASL